MQPLSLEWRVGTIPTIWGHTKGTSTLDVLNRVNENCSLKRLDLNGPGSSRCASVVQWRDGCQRRQVEVRFFPDVLANEEKEVRYVNGNRLPPRQMYSSLAYLVE